MCVLSDVTAVAVADAAAAATLAESFPNSKLSCDILLSIECANEIKSVSLDFVRFEFRGIFDGGGANEPLLEDVGNVDFPLLLLLPPPPPLLLLPPNDDGDEPELQNEPGRGR